jgi:hypothetical protein
MYGLKPVPFKLTHYRALSSIRLPEFITDAPEQ